MKAFLIVALLFSFKYSGASQCFDLFREPQKLATLTNTELQDLAIQIDNFTKNHELANIMSGDLKPNWNHYNTLLGLVEKTENLEKAQALQIANGLKFSAETSKNENFNRFLDYNIAYFKLLAQLNKNLKTDVISMPSFKDLRTEKQLIEDSQKIIQNLEKYVDGEFVKETGFNDKDDLNRKLIKHNPKLAKLVNIVENDLIVTVRRPEGSRFWVPIAGFQNQRVTESSRFYFSDSTKEEVGGRDQAESNLSHIRVKDYVPLSVRLKPNYGEARPDFKNTDLRFLSNADLYGSDIWTIKKSVIESRATWTPTDSVSPGYKGTAKAFIPWKHKALMSLYTMAQFPKNVFGTAQIPSNFSERKPFNWRATGSYLEVQIFGPLGIKDVEAFHFTKNPPNQKTYEILKSNGIKVFDARKNKKIKEYFGEDSK